MSSMSGWAELCLLLGSCTHARCIWVQGWLGDMWHIHVTARSTVVIQPRGSKMLIPQGFHCLNLQNLLGSCL